MSYILAETSTLLLVLLSASRDVSDKCWLMYRGGKGPTYLLKRASWLEWTTCSPEMLVIPVTTMNNKKRKREEKAG